MSKRDEILECWDTLRNRAGGSYWDEKADRLRPELERLLADEPALRQRIEEWGLELLRLKVALRELLKHLGVVDAAEETSCETMAALAESYVQKSPRPQPQAGTTDREQALYDSNWDWFCRCARDATNKTCSAAGLGYEFGDRLRELIADPVAVACLKAAYADGWRATMLIRDELRAAAEESAEPQPLAWRSEPPTEPGRYVVFLPGYGRLREHDYEYLARVELSGLDPDFNPIKPRLVVSCDSCGIADMPVSQIKGTDFWRFACWYGPLPAPAAPGADHV